MNLKHACMMVLGLLAINIYSLAQKLPPQKASQVNSVKGQKPIQEPFMLKGFAPAFADSIAVMITSPSNQAYRGPAGFIQNHQFLLAGQLPGPGIYNIVFTNPKKQGPPHYFNLFLDNEPSAIRFLDNSGNFEVLEGASLKAFSDLIKNFGTKFDQLSKIMQERQNPASNADTLNKQWDRLIAEVENNVPAFLTTHGKTPVAPFLLCTIWPITNQKLDMVDGWVKQVDTNALKNDFGMAIQEYVSNEKKLGYGQVAPGFVQNDPSGKPVDLTAFRGKFVLVDFWASWCGPCRKENPNVVNAFNRFKNKNFTVLGVSLDKDKDKWMSAIVQDNLTWTQVSDLGFWNNEVAKLYKVQSIPQNYMLDPEGKIIGKDLRGEALTQFLEQVLNKTN